MISIEEFCDKHNACKEGREWALTNCKTMLDVWDHAKPDWLIWVATREGVVDDIKLRKFACWSASKCWKSLKDKSSKRAIVIARRFYSGRATKEELISAWSAAWSAARSAAWSAAWSAARSAAWSAAESAAWSAARSAAWSAAQSAAWSAARSDAESAAESAAEKNQSEYIRKHFENPFKEIEQ